MWAFLFSVHIPLDSVKVRKPLFHQIIKPKNGSEHSEIQNNIYNFA